MSRIRIYVVALGSAALYLAGLCPISRADSISGVRQEPAKPASPRIAITNVVDTTGHNLSSIVLDALSVELHNARRFTVVDRANLPEILTQLKIDASGAIDPSQAKEFGKISSIDFILYAVVDRCATPSDNTYVRAEVTVSYYLTSIPEGIRKFSGRVSGKNERVVVSGTAAPSQAGVTADAAAQSVHSGVLQLVASLTPPIRIIEINTERPKPSDWFIRIDKGATDGISKDQVYAISVQKKTKLASGREVLDTEDICDVKLIGERAGEDNSKLAPGRFEKELTIRGVKDKWRFKDSEWTKLFLAMGRLRGVKIDEKQKLVEQMKSALDGLNAKQIEEELILRPK
jgi:hypothetical protein